jgi:hypothetical protein
MKRVASPLSALALAAGVMGAGKGNSLSGKLQSANPSCHCASAVCASGRWAKLAWSGSGVFTKRAAMAWLCGRLTGVVTGLRPNGLARLWVTAAVSQLLLAVIGI